MARPGATALTALVTALALVLGGCSPGPEQDEEDGPVLSAEALVVFGDEVTPRSEGSFGLERTEVVPAAGAGVEQALRVRYPEGSSSPESHREEGTPLGGAQVYLPLVGGAASDVHLRYRVRFEDGFDFVRGGKLPGLYGGSKTSGGDVPDGTDGLSTRLMWRAEGAGEVYAYLPSSRGDGTSLGRGNWTFEPGRWVQVDQYVHLNAVGEEDGRIRVLIDEREVLDERGLVFRTTDALRVDGVFFSTFFGGSDSSWSTPRDQYADFAAFAVTTGDA